MYDFIEETWVSTPKTSYDFKNISPSNCMTYLYQINMNSIRCRCRTVKNFIDYLAMIFILIFWRSEQNENISKLLQYIGQWDLFYFIYRSSPRLFYFISGNEVWKFCTGRWGCFTWNRSLKWFLTSYWWLRAVLFWLNRSPRYVLIIIDAEVCFNFYRLLRFIIPFSC